MPVRKTYWQPVRRCPPPLSSYDIINNPEYKPVKDPIVLSISKFFKV